MDASGSQMMNAPPVAAEAAKRTSKGCGNAEGAYVAAGSSLRGATAGAEARKLLSQSAAADDKT